VNAASLALLAGETQRARELAGAAIAAAEAEQPKDPLDRYFSLATLAEAHLVLGELDAARNEIAEAAGYVRDDHASRATTTRQLQRLLEHLGMRQDILAPLRSPATIHYTGHRFPPDFPAEEEARLAAEIGARLAADDAGFACGSLAAGADILVAEAILARGGVLNVVLPFRVDDFVRISVASSGERWIPRFEACMAAAKRVTYATSDSYLGDDAPYACASRLAMGLAVLQSTYVCGEAYQVALWDERDADAIVAGTAANVRAWRKAGRRTDVINFARAPHAGTAAPRETAVAERKHCSIIFGDVHGFSKLKDSQLLAFQRVVLGACAQVLDRYPSVRLRKTWGDGLFFVVDDAVSAAACALDLQDALAACDLAAAGLPGHLRLRLGAHCGLAYSSRDPVTNVLDVVGEDVSRAARIEPVTPEGMVYVTESFAAELMLDEAHAFRCEYVGEIDAAKGYGRFRMYALARGR
jgi:class 3 adenylate cyclase